LHEIGHAPGIHRHLDGASNNVMYYAVSARDPNLDLTAEDIGMITKLYKNHPVNQLAVERFIGLRAECKALITEPAATAVGALPAEAASLGDPLDLKGETNPRASAMRGHSLKSAP
jgi:hypothetical protein